MMEKIVYIMIISTFMSCTDNEDICRKYARSEYVDLNSENERLCEEGKIEEALNFANEILKSDPDNYVATSNLGAFKYEYFCRDNDCSDDQLKEIYDLYKESIKLCRNYRVGYFNTIEVLAEMAKTKYENDREIVDYLELYNFKWGKRSNLLCKGGEAMFRLGDIDRALEYLNEAIELNPKESMAYIFKAKCYIVRKEWVEAMKLINLGLSMDSLSLGFHERGYVNFQLGKIAEAIQDYKTAISLYQSRWESHFGIGRIEVNRNNVSLACWHFKEAIKVDGADEYVYKWINKYCN